MSKSTGKTFFVRCLTVLALLTFSAIASADRYQIIATKSYKGSISVNQPIEPAGMELNGVKVESVYFSTSEMEFMAIISNRTPMTVHPEIGVSLYDKAGNLIAVGKGGSFKVGSIKAGDRKDLKRKFHDFLDSYNNVASYRLVFTLKEKIRK
jgi:hypothetical protein